MFIPLTYMGGFYAGMIMLVIVGFLDDYRELNHGWKLMAQMLAAILMIFFNKNILHTFGNLFSLGPINLGGYAIPVTIFCVVGVINAFNMIDGVDGLAAGVALIAFGSFAVLSAMDNRMKIMVLSVAMSGALIGFLKYNWHPAQVFMGDAGSFFLGCTAAFISISLTQQPHGIIRPVVPLLILAVPIVDTITLMLTRIIKGKSPFRADRNHLHHLLLRLGLSKKKCVAVIILMSAFFSSVAIFGTILRIPEHYLFAIFVVYFFLYFGLSFYIRKRRIMRAILRYKRVLASKGLREAGWESMR
ncbi:MAG TPA: undecaprenyl/decaprenyl-phosphate alpha-N-acetylglucosaminyl 1-phosphate transferase [Nitrospiraceae bacterium]|nr:undecaprenyl/decaprenyl-phosphate alpha-N-acetylglucosaminyl 1-phosphate transferase [Nitrospiraceae bacterium]